MNKDKLLLTLKALKDKATKNIRGCKERGDDAAIHSHYWNGAHTAYYKLMKRIEEGEFDE